MTRFAVVYEDPSYDDDWVDTPDELREEPWKNDKEFDGPGFIDVTGWTADEVRRLGHADE
jgi:hypothetical protein